MVDFRAFILWTGNDCGLVCRYVFVMATNPEACLDSLSDELIVEIFLYLLRHKASFLLILRTSKRYNRITEPMLYQTIYDYGSGRINEDYSFFKLRTVANRPDLASCVGEIEIEAEEACKPEKCIECENILVRVLRNAVSIKRLGIEACVVACQEDEGFSSDEGYSEEENDSEEEYGSDKDGADEEDSSDEEDDPNHDDSLKWVALTSFTWLKLFDTSVHDASASRFNTFTKLENLSISASTFPKGMQAIFQLPALDTLEFKNLHHDTAIDDWDVPDRSSNIKELHVSDCLRDSLWCKCKSQQPLFPEKAMREDSRC
jgi:hypothetical protein